MKTINAFWMRSNNFGDKLTPYFIKKISGYDATFNNTSNDISNVICVGSILNWARDKDVVWGAGSAYSTMANSTLGINKNCTIRSVRGPLSRDWAIKCGHTDVPEIYGDPAMLLPKFYNPTVDKKYKLGIIPHVVEYKHITPPPRDDILLINLADNIESVIRNILQCENIASSSLHGIITADAYNIPCKWIKLSDKIKGDGTKYYDHYKSIGIDEVSPLVVDSRSINMDILRHICKYDVNFDSDKLLNVCPF